MLGHLWNLLWRSFQDFPTILSGNWLSILLPLALFILKESGKLRDLWRDKNRWREITAPVRRDFRILVAVYVALFGLAVARTVYRDHEYFVTVNGDLRKKLSDSQKTDPQLGGAINVSSIPAGKDEVLVVQGVITNLGSPTVLTTWSVDLHFPDGSSQAGQILVPPGHDIGFKRGLYLSKDDYLPQLCKRIPIPTGGACTSWLYARFTDMDHIKLMEKHGTVVLTYSDVRGKKWSLEQLISKETQMPPPLGLGDVLNPQK